MDVGFEKWCQTIGQQGAMQEGSNATGKDHGTRDKASARIGFNFEVIPLGVQRLNQLTQVKLGVEGFALQQESLGELTSCASQSAWYVIDQFVPKELCGLTASVGECIYDLGVNSQEPQFKDQKETRRTCAHDQDIAFDAWGLVSQIDGGLWLGLSAVQRSRP